MAVTGSRCFETIVSDITSRQTHAAYVCGVLREAARVHDTSIASLGTLEFYVCILSVIGS